jgi:hypothetical protein
LLFIAYFCSDSLCKSEGGAVSTACDFDKRNI